MERLARDVARGERAPDDLHAALSPDVALALVARVRELEAEVARLRGDRDAHRFWSKGKEWRDERRP